MHHGHGVGRRDGRLPHLLWIGLILAGLVSALIPLDPGSSLANPSLTRLELPEQFYRFIKATMLWVPIGLMFGIAGLGNIPRAWVGLLVAVLFLYFGISLDVIHIAILQEILAVAPGLAAGLWLGERSRSAERMQQSSPATAKSGSVIITPVTIESASHELASTDGSSAFNPKKTPRSEDCSVVYPVPFVFQKLYYHLIVRLIVMHFQWLRTKVQKFYPGHPDLQRRFG